MDVRHLIQQLLDRHIPQSFKQDPKDYRRASVFIMFFISIFCFLIPTAILNFFLEYYWALWHNLSLIIGSIGTYYFFQARKNLVSVAWILFLSGLLSSSYLAYFEGSYVSSGFLLVAAAPIMGFWIGNRKIGIIHTFIGIVWAFVLFPILSRYVLPPAPTPTPWLSEYVYILNLGFITLLIATIMLWNDYSMEELIRKLREKDQYILRQEKMASLGGLTAGIAHEINNPLNFVISNTHALKLDFQELNQLLNEVHNLKDERKISQIDQIIQKIDELDTQFLQDEMEKLVESIERGALRTKNIVAGLRTFARNEPGKFVHADIHEGLDSTLTILNNRLKDGIQVVKSYGNLPKVECQFDALNQVFMNILNNAIQSIEGEGEIIIKTWQEKKEVFISIQDSGKGISNTDKKRIFEPFFTTKPVGEGTGLGLSISYGIIQQHGGMIRIDSEQGKGSTFTISLPMIQI